MTAPKILCQFSFPCEKSWNDLSEIAGQQDVRFCTECTKPVFLCLSYEDLYEHVEKERCVAVPISEEDLRLGRPGRPQD